MTTVSDFGAVPESLQVCCLEAVGTSTRGTGGHIRATGNVGVRGTVDLGGLKVAGKDFLFNSQLLGRTFHNAFINSTALGSNLMFTVPVGKKARPFFFTVYNPTVSAVLFYPEWNFGSGFIRYQANSQSNPSVVPTPATWNGDILEAGHSFSINTATAGVTAYVNYVLFPSTEPTQSYRVLMSSVKQTLFTCPAGKVAVNTTDNINGTINTQIALRLMNTTANTPVATVTLETSTTPETTIHRIPTLTGLSNTSVPLGFLKAGDIIRVVLDSNDAVYATPNLTLLDQ